MRSAGRFAAALFALGSLANCGDRTPSAPGETVPATHPPSTIEVLHLVDRPDWIEVRGPLSEWQLPAELTRPLATLPLGSETESVAELSWPPVAPQAMRVLAGEADVPRVLDLERWSAGEQGWIFVPRLQRSVADEITQMQGRRTPPAVGVTPHLKLRHGDWCEVLFAALDAECAIGVRASAGPHSVRLRLLLDGVELGSADLEDAGAQEREFSVSAVEQGVRRLRVEVTDLTRSTEEAPVGPPVLLLEWIEWRSGEVDRLWLRSTQPGPRSLRFLPRTPWVVERGAASATQARRPALLSLGGGMELRCSGPTDASQEITIHSEGVALTTAQGWIPAVPAGLCTLDLPAGAVAWQCFQPAARWIRSFEDQEVHHPDDGLGALEDDAPSALRRSLGRFEAGQERRLGFLLPEGSVLEASIPQAHHDRRLRFSVGRFVNSEPELEDFLSRPECTAQVRLFESDRLCYEVVGAGAGWSEHVVDLPARALQLRFEVRATVPGRDGVVLGDPRLLERIEGEERPNLVVYLTDTLRADHLGCYGSARPTSPNLDRIAAQCYRFAQLRAVASWTRPTVATLFTGVMPSHHGILVESAALPYEVVTLAEMMRDHGSTNWAAIANLQVSALGVHFEQGFHRFVPPEGTGVPEPRLQIEPSSRPLGRTAREMLEQLVDEPFFLYLHSMDPHFPYRPAEALRGHFSADYSGPLGERELVFLTELLISLQRQGLNDPVALQQSVEYLKEVYDEEILGQDEEWGRLWSTLESTGRLENTVVLFLSDHGEEFNEHGRLTHAGRMWEELLRVPGLLYVPPRWRERWNLAPPSVIETPVSQVDLLPTLLDLWNIVPFVPVHGRSLRPLLAAESPSGSAANDGPTGTESREAADLGAWLKGEWKLLYEPKPMRILGESGQLRAVSEESADGRLHVLEERVWRLFDLHADPEERVDLSNSEFPRMRALLVELAARQRWLDQVGVPSFYSDFRPSADVVANLQALGYLSADAPSEGVRQVESLQDSESAVYFAPGLDRGRFQVADRRLTWETETQVRPDEAFPVRVYRLEDLAGVDSNPRTELTHREPQTLIRMMKLKRELEQVLFQRGELLDPKEREFQGRNWVKLQR